MWEVELKEIPEMRDVFEARDQVIVEEKRDELRLIGEVFDFRKTIVVEPNRFEVDIFV